MRTPQRLFVIFSAAILVVVVVFVVVNNHAAQRSLNRSLAERAEAFRSAYEVAMSSTLASAAQMSAIVAADVETARYISRARASRQTGAVNGSGDEAADVRYEWLRAIQPTFTTLHRRYGMSELSLDVVRDETAVTVLRVHRPESYGDTVASPAHPVRRTLAGQADAAGAVLDADGASLRATAAVHAVDPDSGMEGLIGIVEAGLSFDALLRLLNERLEVQAALVLPRAEVEATVEPSVIRRHMTLLPESGCYALAMAGAYAAQLSAGMDTCIPLRDAKAPDVVMAGSRRFARVPVTVDLGVTAAPGHAGVILWFDAEAALAAYEDTLALNIAYAVGGFVLLELLLFVLLRAGVGFFESELRRRTTEIRQLNRKLTHMATIDSLTGLNNRRHFLQRMQIEMDRVRRVGGDIALILIDLDHFKAINDQYGHQAGDEVLRKVGQYLRDQIRSIDTAGRYGGEELCVLLPETDAEQAMAIAERLRREIAGIRFKTPGGEEFRITASLGVAEWDGMSDRDTLFVQADNALYASKDAGRDTVTLFGEPGVASAR